VHDLLICQCDRHAQNVMISESGNFKLIDNEWSWQFFVNPCAMDSIFLGTTQKQEILRLGNSMVLKQVRGVAGSGCVALLRLGGAAGAAAAAKAPASSQQQPRLVPADAVVGPGLTRGS
jgi:hypothetical protein